MNQTFKLSIREQIALIDVIDALGRVTTSEQFCACLDTDMQRVFPHEMLACGIANLEGENVIPYRLLLNHFPQSYMDSLKTEDGGFNSALIERWRAIRKPVLVELEHDVEGWPQDWLDNAKQYAFRNFAQNGIIDFPGATGSSFSFARIPGRLTEKHAYLLTHLAPHLHIALMRSMTAEAASTQAEQKAALPPTFTSRQLEVLQWLCNGKTNWEIGQILGTTEDTIKYHLSQVFTKLEVSSRAQAVAAALRMKIIKY